jgi:hypothetical protein
MSESFRTRGARVSRLARNLCSWSREYFFVNAPSFQALARFLRLKLLGDLRKLKFGRPCGSSVMIVKAWP